jgi:hypothetical protein
MWISFVRIGNGKEKYVEEVIPSEGDVDVRCLSMWMLM